MLTAPPKLFWVCLLIMALIYGLTTLINQEKDLPAVSSLSVTLSPIAVGPLENTTSRALFVSECGPEGGYDPSGPEFSLQQLWDANVCPILKEELWIGQTAYDYGHFLMIPLHAAFQLEKKDWQEQFSEHFQRYMDQEPRILLIEGNSLNRLHYVYLASQFLVLADQYQRTDLIPPGFVDAIYKTIEVMWDQVPSPGGSYTDISGKLGDPNAIITDSDMFIFAISADLLTHERMIESEVSPSILSDILDIARMAVEERVVFYENGGWLFQPGRWSNSPEYAYAGRDEKIPGMTPSLLPDVAEDTSHSHRWPLWLKSLANAYITSTSEREFYNDLRKGLEQQFFDKVLVTPTVDFPAYRTNNFMDGRNGIYRWEYGSLGANEGFGPYELSGTMMIGWWTFLDTQRIRDVYQDTAERFPLSPGVIEMYWWHMDGVPHWYRDGYYELIARLAAKLPLKATLQPLKE